MKNLTLLVARILLAALFIMAGYNKAMNFEQTAEQMDQKFVAEVPYYPDLKEQVAEFDLGVSAGQILAGATVFIELGGGVLIAIGFLARLFAFLIFLFIIPVTYLYHPFWVDPGEMNAFLKNVAIMGGMLYLFVRGPGGFSLLGERKGDEVDDEETL